MSDSRDENLAPPTAEEAEDSLRSMLRGALKDESPAPDVLAGVQKKIRERSKGKFWTGLGLAVLSIPLDFVVVGIFVALGVWVWAIIDAATKPDAFYTRYPNV